jgi:hypothetical protein
VVQSKTICCCTGTPRRSRARAGFPVSSSRTCPFRLTTCMPPGTRHEPLFLPRPGPALSRPAAPNGWSGQLLYYRRSRSRSLAGHPPPPRSVRRTERSRAPLVRLTVRSLSTRRDGIAAAAAPARDGAAAP